MHMNQVHILYILYFQWLNMFQLGISNMMKLYYYLNKYLLDNEGTVQIQELGNMIRLNIQYNS